METAKILYPDAKFLGMNFQQFADINTLGITSLLILDLFLILFFFYKKDLFKNIKYEYYVYALGALLFVAVFGANVYERVFGDKPCEYCWYQRVLIYPMLFLTIAEIFYKTKVVHKFIGVFATMTAFLASYHYYFHYMRYVKNDILSLPCSTNPLIPNCTEAGVVSFGFVTMPLLSVGLALTVLTFVFLMRKVK
jgi:disulfide bond formation protein DsbB